jgi:hypothetical protein
MITLDDSVLQQIREIRHQISQNNQHDPHKLIKYYLELQQQYKQKDQKLNRDENPDFLDQVGGLGY